MIDSRRSAHAHLHHSLWENRIERLPVVHTPLLHIVIIAIDAVQALTYLGVGVVQRGIREGRVPPRQIAVPGRREPARHATIVSHPVRQAREPFLQPMEVFISLAHEV